jgi:hypothetical protein
MKVSITLFSLLIALHAVPAAIGPVSAKPASAKAMQREDEFDGQKLQLDYRRVYAAGYGMGMAPYAAEAVTETTRTLADGNQIRSRDAGIRARDKDGRVRITYKSASGKERIFIADLKASTGWLVRPDRKDVLRITGVPPAARLIRPYPAPARAPDWSKEVRMPLGVKDFAGIKAVGYQVETHYPAGARGNEKEMMETREYWFAQELSEMVYSRNFSPTGGERIVRLENLKPGDAPEELFAIPQEYPVRDIVFTAAAEPAEAGEAP